MTGGGPGAGRREEQKSGLGGLWLMLLPLACCGAPLLIGVLAAAGALAWGGIGLAAAVVVAAVAVLVIRRRRRSCLPGEGCQPDDTETMPGAWRR